jgi:hypothetical protein
MDKRRGLHSVLKRRIVVSFVLAFLAAARVFLRGRTDTALEVLALRQQVAVLKRKRPRSGALKGGRGRFRLSIPSCWRRASTSRAVSARLRTNTRTTGQESEEE